MSVSFEIDMDALAAAIDKLPAELQAQADRVVSAAAKRTAAKVRAAYRQARSSVDTYSVGGIKMQRRHLADSVRVTTTNRNRGRVETRVVVDAPHAHLYEYGTGAKNENPGPKASGSDRQTAAGVNRGSSEAHPTLVPIAIRERQQMVDEIVAMAEAAGFEVRRSV